MNAALIAAALAGLTPPPAAQSAAVLPDAEPALWVVNDEDTVIYLFGTFHALDGKADWFNDEVMTAFTESDELVLETLVPSSLAAPKPRAAPGLGLQAVGPFAGSASFLSTSRAVMSAGRSRGMSTAHGADTVLRDAAEVSGKPVGGLESFDFQIRMFSRMPGATAPTDPRQAATSKAAIAALLGRLQSAWNRGDIDSFSPMLEQMRASSPETYKLLFFDRNQRWAGWIARRLQKPGVVFVAVGAGHLAGRDSVQHKLSQYGIRTARVN